MPNAIFAQADNTVSGTVTSLDDGETLPGVNVQVKGTSTGTSTQGDGSYELNVPSLQDTLVFSFVGFSTKTIPINGRTTLDVEMTSEAVLDRKSVVVGYGVRKKKL